jgi:hypothetical protein
VAAVCVCVGKLNKDGRSTNKFRKSQIRKFSDFFLYWGPSVNVAMCGFAICGPYILCDLQIYDLRTGTPQKFADLRLQNEPKNLRRGITKRICVPTFETEPYSLKVRTRTEDCKDNRTYSEIIGGHYRPVTALDDHMVDGSGDCDRLEASDPVP